MVRAPVPTTPMGLIVVPLAFCQFKVAAWPVAEESPKVMVPLLIEAVPMAFACTFTVPDLMTRPQVNALEFESVIAEVWLFCTIPVTFDPMLPLKINVPEPVPLLVMDPEGLMELLKV